MSHRSLLDDAPSELVLLRRCADVCKVTHLLRACGPQVAEDALGEYDAVLRATLERTLGGDIPEAAALQATAAVSDGGLGMRRATDVAAPALIASCVQTRPFVRHLFGQLAGFGLDPARFLIEFDATAAMAINGRAPRTPTSSLRRPWGRQNPAWQRSWAGRRGMRRRRLPWLRPRSWRQWAQRTPRPEREGISRACCAPFATQSAWMVSRGPWRQHGTTAAHGVCGN